MNTKLVQHAMTAPLTADTSIPLPKPHGHTAAAVERSFNTASAAAAAVQATSLLQQQSGAFSADGWDTRGASCHHSKEKSQGHNRHHRQNQPPLGAPKASVEPVVKCGLLRADQQQQPQHTHALCQHTRTHLHTQTLMQPQHRLWLA